MSNRKIEKPVFNKVAIRTPRGFKGKMSGECEEGAAFALYMLLRGDKLTKEGVAGKFQAARLAYLAAATKYHATLLTKTGGVAP